MDLKDTGAWLGLSMREGLWQNDWLSLPLLVEMSSTTLVAFMVLSKFYILYIICIIFEIWPLENMVVDFWYIRHSSSLSSRRFVKTSVQHFQEIRFHNCSVYQKNKNTINWLEIVVWRFFIITAIDKDCCNSVSILYKTIK